MDKLTIQNEMHEFDLKSRSFYNNLTPEEKKKFSTFLMIRWGSSVIGQSELQEYYLASTNERLNKHFFAISKHPALQWLCASSVSPGMGSHRHQWIAPKKKDSANNETKKILAELMPGSKMDDINVLSTLVTKAEIKELVRSYGKNDK